MFEAAVFMPMVKEFLTELQRANAMRARQIELLDEFVENNRRLLEISANQDKEAHDPEFQAARQLAMQMGLPEVVKVWNDVHPLTPIQIQHRPRPGEVAPAGKLS